MNSLAAQIALALSIGGTLWCWWRIRRSDDPAFFKVLLAIVAAMPYLGPFFYFFTEMPPRRRRVPEPGVKPEPRKPPSEFLKRWNEREHVYLFWASFVFWSLAVLAYWMHDWHPGRIIDGPWGSFTEVDVTFFSLLVGAVVTSGAALRAKVHLQRQLRQASRAILQ